MNGPHSVSWKMKVKASSGRVEPIQANTLERRSTSGWKCSIYLSRKRLLMPSANTTRSASAKRASSSMSASNVKVTPSSRARSCRIKSSLRREQPQKPLPPTRCTVPRKCTAISRGIVFLEIVQRGVGKHHAKAEGVVGAVTLIHRDLGVWPLFFKQDRSVETGRSATDDRDLHESLRRSGTIRIVLNLKHFVGKTRRPFVARMERSAIRDSLGTRRPPGFAEFIIGRAFARPVGS